MQQTQSIPYGRISLFFIFILFLLSWGFYKTYLIFFPSFTGFNSVQHFHGAMMLIWMTMLIVQPLLIRMDKIQIHRFIGKLSFIIAPLVVVSIFLASRMVYLRPQPPLPHAEKIGLIALSFPGLVAFAIFYTLAIINRRNTYHHMRYMIGTSLLMIGPGLGRALILNFHFSLPGAVMYTNYLSMGIAVVMMVNDIVRKRSFTANGILVAVLVLMHLAWTFRLSPVWQNIGEFIAANFFQ